MWPGQCDIQSFLRTEIVSVRRGKPTINQYCVGEKLAVVPSTNDTGNN